MTFISKLAQHATETGFKSTFSYNSFVSYFNREKYNTWRFKNRNLEPRMKGGIAVLSSTTLQSFYSSIQPCHNIS